MYPIVFPGGFLPTLTFLMTTLADGSKGKLVVESVANIGPHYAKTLRVWRQNFMQTFNASIRPALLAEHQTDRKGKGMSEEDVDLFRRKWEYYFSYCEAGFATKTLGDIILTVGREGAVGMMENVPL